MHTQRTASGGGARESVVQKAEGEESKSHGSDDIRNYSGTPQAKGKIPWTLTHGFLLEMKGLVLLKDAQDGEVKPEARVVTVVKELPIPFDMPIAHIKDRNKGDTLTKAIALVQTSWFVIQCIARWIARLPVTGLEVVTFSFAVLNAVIYGLWWYKPQSVEVPIGLPTPVKQWNELPASSAGIRRIDGIDNSTYNPYIPFDAHLRKTGRSLRNPQNRIARLWMFIFDPLDSDEKKSVGRAALWRYIILLYFVGAVFGGIHLIPIWLGSFPSQIELQLWIFSAVGVTTIPILLPLLRPLMGFAYSSFLPIRWVLKGGTYFVATIYTCCRLISLALVFSTLRGLPQKTYYNIEWSAFIPHFKS